MLSFSFDILKKYWGQRIVLDFGDLKQSTQCPYFLFQRKVLAQKSSQDVIMLSVKVGLDQTDVSFWLSNLLNLSSELQTLKLFSVMKHWNQRGN